ncbi:MAG: hypothetical protein PF517_07515 [Salinivirgaceae bacterium]|jgi:hypothetical protein|nr:hypothetical protein [Salinivirgaceae bacterium]
MTLIVSVLTEKNAFLICDKMHSINGTKEKPVKANVKVGTMNLNITAPNVRINSGTKIYKIKEDILVGGAGS